MKNKYTGPYQITGISSNGQYYLKDKYSHQLKRQVPANQLIHFYGFGGFSRKPKKLMSKIVKAIHQMKLMMQLLTLTVFLVEPISLKVSNRIMAFCLILIVYKMT